MSLAPWDMFPPYHRPTEWSRFGETWPSHSNYFQAPMNAMWKDFDRSVHNFERDIEHMKRQAEHSFGPHYNYKPYSTELCSFPSRPTSLLEHYSFLNPVRIDTCGNRWLNLCFDLRTFKPEEIKVILNTKERCVHVEAEHEVKDVKEHYIRRHYNRKFFIPQELKLDLSKLELKSYLTHEGLLYVEAALPKLSIEEAKKSGSILHPYGTHFGFTPVTTVSVPVKHT